MAKKFFWSFKELVFLPHNEKYKPGGTMGSHHLFLIPYFRDENTLKEGKKEDITELEVWGNPTSGAPRKISVFPGDLIGYLAGEVWRCKPLHKINCPIRRALRELKLPQEIVEFQTPPYVEEDAVDALDVLKGGAERRSQIQEQDPNWVRQYKAIIIGGYRQTSLFTRTRWIDNIVVNPEASKEEVALWLKRRYSELRIGVRVCR